MHRPSAVPTWMLLALASASLSAIFFFTPEQKPDHSGFLRCIKLHPERYCRIANGFHVEPLDKEQPTPDN